MFTVLSAAGGYTMSENTKVIARIRRLMALGIHHTGICGFQLQISIRWLRGWLIFS